MYVLNYTGTTTTRQPPHSPPREKERNAEQTPESIAYPNETMIEEAKLDKMMHGAAATSAGVDGDTAEVVPESKMTTTTTSKSRNQKDPNETTKEEAEADKMMNEAAATRVDSNTEHVVLESKITTTTTSNSRNQTDPNETTKEEAAADKMMNAAAATSVDCNTAHVVLESKMTTTTTSNSRNQTTRCTSSHGNGTGNGVVDVRAGTKISHSSPTGGGGRIDSKGYSLDDILCTYWACDPHHHPGNIHYDKTVEKYRTQYQSAPKISHVRKAILQQVLEEALSRGGKFKLLNEETGRWVEMKPYDIRIKIACGLRINPKGKSLPEEAIQKPPPAGGGSGAVANSPPPPKEQHEQQVEVVSNVKVGKVKVGKKGFPKKEQEQQDQETNNATNEANCNQDNCAYQKYDILCGAFRSGQSHSLITHPGNQRYYHILDKYLVDYQNAEPLGPVRKGIMEQAMSEILSNGARFMINNKRSNNKWVQMTGLDIRIKVSNALRLTKSKLRYSKPKKPKSNAADDSGPPPYGENDILCARGNPGNICNHPGNIRYHEILEKHRKEYETTCKFKGHIRETFLKRVLNEILSNGGRFMIRSRQTNKWNEMTFFKVEEKVKLAFAKFTVNYRPKFRYIKTKVDDEQASLSEAPSKAEKQEQPQPQHQENVSEDTKAKAIENEASTEAPATGAPPASDDDIQNPTQHTPDPPYFHPTIFPPHFLTHMPNPPYIYPTMYPPHHISNPLTEAGSFPADFFPRPKESVPEDSDNKAFADAVPEAEDNKNKDIDSKASADDVTEAALQAEASALREVDLPQQQDKASSKIERFRNSSEQTTSAQQNGKLEAASMLQKVLEQIQSSGIRFMASNKDDCTLVEMQTRDVRDKMLQALLSSDGAVPDDNAEMAGPPLLPNAMNDTSTQKQQFNLNGPSRTFPPTQTTDIAAQMPPQFSNAFGPPHFVVARNPYTAPYTWAGNQPYSINVAGGAFQDPRHEGDKPIRSATNGQQSPAEEMGTMNLTPTPDAVLSFSNTSTGDGFDATSNRKRKATPRMPLASAATTIPQETTSGVAALQQKRQKTGRAGSTAFMTSDTVSVGSAGSSDNEEEDDVYQRLQLFLGRKPSPNFF